MVLQRATVHKWIHSISVVLKFHGGGGGQLGKKKNLKK